MPDIHGRATEPSEVRGDGKGAIGCDIEAGGRGWWWGRDGEWLLVTVAGRQAGDVSTASLDPAHDKSHRAIGEPNSGSDAMIEGSRLTQHGSHEATLELCSGGGFRSNLY